jgi:hypothetical protein
MHDRTQQARGTQRAHDIFIFLGLIFLVSAVGGHDLTSYGMGLGLLLMGLFAPHRERVFLATKVDRAIYVGAALLVIAAGSVQLVSAGLEAVRVLRGSEAVLQPGSMGMRLRS